MVNDQEFQTNQDHLREEQQNNLIDRIFKSVETETITPFGFISDAKQLLEITQKPLETKQYLKIALKVAKIEPAIQDHLANLLFDSCTRGDLEEIRSYLKVYKALDLGQKPNVKDYLKKVQKLFPDIDSPEVPSPIPATEPDKVKTAEKASPPSNFHRRISRRLLVPGGVGVALAIGGMITLGTIVDAPGKASAPPSPMPPNSPSSEYKPPEKLYPPPNPHLGIRNDNEKLMTLVPEMGAKVVRIDGGTSDTLSDGSLEDENVKRLIKTAKSLNLDVLYNFNPQRLLTEDEIEKRITAIFSAGDNIILELGNEPDDINVAFWLDRNMDSFAEFINRSLKTVDKLKQAGRINPQIKVVIGTPLAEANLKKLVTHLRNRGIDTTKLIFAGHAYHTPEKVAEVAQSIKNATGGKVMFTEIGVNGGGKENVDGDNGQIYELIDLYQAARSYSDEAIVIHELPDNGPDPVTKERFGLVDPITGKPLPTYNIVKDRIRDVEDKLTLKKTAQNP